MTIIIYSSNLKVKDKLLVLTKDKLVESENEFKKIKYIK
jgi:hypothetical protein